MVSQMDLGPNSMGGFVYAYLLLMVNYEFSANVLDDNFPDSIRKLIAHLY